MVGTPEDTCMFSGCEVTGIGRRTRQPRQRVLSCLILPVLCLMVLSACAPQRLSSNGTVLLSGRTSDTALRETAVNLTGLNYSERIQAEYWLQRYNQDRTAGTVADLYIAEWNREIFDLLRNTGDPVPALSQDRFQALWDRSVSYRRSPDWLTALPYGPSQGFVPTAAYIWGLFLQSEDSTLAGSWSFSTLDEIEKAFSQVAAGGKTPIALGTAFGWPGAAWFTMLDLRLNGPEAVWGRYEGKRPWNDDGARAVFRRLADWRDRGWFESGAAIGTQEDMIAAVSSGSAWCALLGAYAIDRFPRPREISFLPFPAADTSTSRAEMASLTGFLIPASSSSIEAALALADEYILSGSPGHIKDSYRIPVATTLQPVKSNDPIPPAARQESLSSLKKIQAVTLAAATSVVPSFDRAMSAQAVQDSTRLWAEFFAPGGPDGDSFAARLQRVLGRSTP